MSNLSTPSLTPQPLSLPASLSNPVDELKLNDPTNIEEWNKLFAKVDDDSIEQDENQVNYIFESYLSIFPNDYDIWDRYVKYYLKAKNYKKVEEIFKKCLNKRSIKLWKTYLYFLQLINDTITGGATARNNVLKAFDYALMEIGIDFLNSEIIVDEYVDYLNKWTGINETENNEKLKIKQKLMKKIVKIPNKNLQRYWEYFTENCASKTDISDNSSDYLKSKLFSINLSNLIKNLDDDYKQTNSKMDLKSFEQLKIFQQWLEYEKKNKLELPQDLLNYRIEYCYLQALYHLRFIPELWLEYSKFKASLPSLPTEISSHQQSINILKDGILSNKLSFSLSFQLAEMYEQVNDFENSKKTYENLVESLTKIYNKLEFQIEDLFKKQELFNKSEEERLKNKRQKELAEIEEQDINEEKSTEILNEKIPENFEIKINNQFEIEKLKKEQELYGRSITLVYSNYMRFFKRSHGYVEARKIFAKCKKFQGHTWHIYYDNAIIEYYSNLKEFKEPKISIKIFELAMKKSKFNLDINFILKYLKFLIDINDLTNAKVLFENSLKNFEKIKIEDGKNSKIKKLFKFFLKIENLIDNDLNSIKSLEERYLDYFQNEKNDEKSDTFLTLIEDRFEDHDHFDPIKIFDMSGGYEIYERQLKRKGNNNGFSTTKRQNLGEFNSNGSGSGSGSGISGVTGGITDEEMDEDSDYEPGFDDNGLNNSVDVTDNKSYEVTEPFMQDEVYNLLRVLPNASYFNPSMFDEDKIVDFLQKLALN